MLTCRERSGFENLRLQLQIILRQSGLSPGGERAQHWQKTLPLTGRTLEQDQAKVYFAYSDVYSNRYVPVSTLAH